MHQIKSVVHTCNWHSVKCYDEKQTHLQLERERPTVQQKTKQNRYRQILRKINTRCLILFIVREMCLRHEFYHTKLAKAQKLNNMFCQKSTEPGTPLCFWQECKFLRIQWRVIWKYLSELNKYTFPAHETTEVKQFLQYCS